MKSFRSVAQLPPQPMAPRDDWVSVARRGAYLAAGGALVLGALGALAPVSSASAQATQILQPQGSAAEILQADRIIRLRLLLPVEPEVAYDAWTDASQLVEWLPHWAEMTVAEGSGFEMGWEGYDGTWTGSYLEVDRPDVLAFTWMPPESVFPAGSYETEVHIRFEPVDSGGTRLVLEHSGFRGTEEMEAQLQAWRPYLFALRAFLLQRPIDR